MFESIWRDIKDTFRNGNMVNRLILINVAVFVLTVLIKIIFQVQGLKLLHHFQISGDLGIMIRQPWALFTYMFMHDLGSIWHILWNMLIFYWFGRIVGDLIGDDKIWPLYLLGGIMAALAFLAYSLLLGRHGYALGASGAVMAFVVAAAFIAPDYNMRLLLIGDVKIKYIAAVILIIDLVGMANNVNTGGHIGHLGGALMGYIFVASLRQGSDLSEGINRFFSWLTSALSVRESVKPQRKQKKGKIIKMPTAARGKHKQDQDEFEHFQDRLDAILDKIKKQGYDSLTEEEKSFLKNASKKD